MADGRRGDHGRRALRDELLSRRHRGERIVPDGRLRFGEAAATWLDGPVRDLRLRTRECYRNAVHRYLQPEFGSRRLDVISPDDLAELVRQLRQLGLAESSIVIVVGVANRIYRYAARRLGWSGTNPVTLMLPSEQPKLSQAKRRRIFLTGARLSELLAITWADVHLDDVDDAEIEFGAQVDRYGNRQPTKTDASARTVPIPKELALRLAEHKPGSSYSKPGDFVFCTRSGRPLGQRNVIRALRLAQQRAVDERGDPTFPELHERDKQGRPMPVPRGALPSMHSFRHTAATRALLAGESVDEIAFLLGHRDANVTRAVYVRELADSRRRKMRRSRMIAEYGDLLKP